jgi:hypothetical protein
VRRLASVFALLLLVTCKDTSGQRGIDGGAFTIPDAGFIDAGFYDSGLNDAGPYQCPVTCSGGQVCGCILGDCGCHTPKAFNEPCDVQHPETCESPFQCVRARSEGFDIDICSDGRLGIACSKTADICTTQLGCVCYTDASSTTDCRCRDAHDPNNELCDRFVPETCPNGVCVRAIGSGGGAFFFCSDGAEGRACEPGDGSCQTSLGCTCPIVFGQARCTCGEPAEAGEACDPNVAGACVAPLMCLPQQTPGRGITTVCGSGQGRDGGSGAPGSCDPNDPNSCPPGTACIMTAQGFQCVMR